MALLAPIIIARASRRRGPEHRVRLNPVTLRPEGCTCRAGQLGNVCWAALEVAAGEAFWIAWDRMEQAGRSPGYESHAYDQAAQVVLKAAHRARIAEAAMEARAVKPTPRKAA